jgi:hypothetical protein
MRLTHAHKELIQERLTKLGINHEELANKVGKSAPWVTKLLKPMSKGGLQSLKDADVEKIEVGLSFTFLSLKTQTVAIPPIVLRFMEVAEGNPELYRIIKVLTEGYSKPKDKADHSMSFEKRVEVGKMLYRQACEIEKHDDGSLNYAKLQADVRAAYIALDV